MSVTSVFLVGVGAAAGAAGRHLISRLVARWHQGVYPWGTWVSNLLGTFLIANFFRYLGAPGHGGTWWVLLGTGYCGGLTTFSTLCFETRELFKVKAVRGLIYILSSVVLGFAVAYLFQRGLP